MTQDDKRAYFAFWTKKSLKDDAWKNEMKIQSNIFLYKKAFSLTFDSQNKHVTEQNIISIPLAPNSSPSVIVFFANFSLNYSKEWILKNG